MPTLGKNKGNKPIVSNLKKIHDDRDLKVYDSLQLTAKIQEEHGITQIMSAKGYCYDNAADGSVFVREKDIRFVTKTKTRRMFFDYLEVFYNNKWIHGSLGIFSPETHFNQYFPTQETYSF